MAEQHDLALFTPRYQRKQRVLLVESGEIVEVAVLAVIVFGVVTPSAGRRGGDERDAIRLHLCHQFFAALLVFAVILIHSFLAARLS